MRNCVTLRLGAKNLLSVNKGGDRVEEYTVFPRPPDPNLPELPEQAKRSLITNAGAGPALDCDSVTRLAA